MFNPPNSLNWSYLRVFSYILSILSAYLSIYLPINLYHHRIYSVTYRFMSCPYPWHLGVYLITYPLCYRHLPQPQPPKVSAISFSVTLCFGSGQFLKAIIPSPPPSRTSLLILCLPPWSIATLQPYLSTPLSLHLQVIPILCNTLFHLYHLRVYTSRAFSFPAAKNTAEKESI